MERPLFRKEKPNLVFKIFFNPDSGRCLHKTTGAEVGQLPYIIVDHSTYNIVDVCSNYKVTNGLLEKIKTGINCKKLAKVNNGAFKTVKNCMIFIVGEDYAEPVDTWDYYRNDH